MVDVKFTILFLVATAAISSSIFFGLARPWESAEPEASAPEASAPESLVPTPRSISQVSGPTLEAAPATQTIPTGVRDRTSCDAIRGTAYRSESERRWFLETCIAPSNPTELFVQPVTEPQAPSIDQIVTDQWTACSETWWEGNSVETAIAVTQLVEANSSALQTLFEKLRGYLQTNCETIGSALAVVSRAERLCGPRLSELAAVQVSIDLARLDGSGTYSLGFALGALNGFVNGAGC